MMEHSDSTRKKPRQRRAAVTVSALLEAGFQVLERDGYDRFGTTAVAERAGVSIGTLYQYFANKNELLKAMARQEIEELLRGISGAFDGAAKGYRARPIVQAILRTFWNAPPSRQAVFPVMLRYMARNELMNQVKALTAGIGRDLAVKEALSDEAAFVLTRAVLGAVSAAITESHDLERTRLEDELVDLILGYLDRKRSV